MRTVGIAMLLLGGCSFEHGKLSGSTTDDAAVIDGVIADVVGSDVPLQATCIGSGTYEICAMPMQPVTLTGSIDTGTSNLCSLTQLWTGGGQPDACFIAGTGITLASGSTVTVSGTRPLVLFSAGSISIAGVLDAASHRNPAATGPGSPSSACDDFARAAGSSSSGGAGGAGGSFMSQGGDGGDGNGTNSEGQSASAESASPTVLRAGCHGQQGGDGDGNAGAPGRGGGVVYLAAGGTILIDGAINVSGSGASATTETKTGGSGAGSGGMIKLHAGAIAGGGVLMANGGGGASGGGETNDGNPGSDPATGTATTAAPGGARVGNSGLGGVGFAGSTQAANGGAGTGNNTGGGGGGGGGGYIQSNLALGSLTVSAGIIDAP